MEEQARPKRKAGCSSRPEGTIFRRVSGRASNPGNRNGYYGGSTPLAASTFGGNLKHRVILFILALADLFDSLITVATLTLVRPGLAYWASNRMLDSAWFWR